VLPAIATMLGPRVVPDGQATRWLIDPTVRDRHMLGVADIAYALGQDRARAYLADALKEHPDLAGGLDKARAVASQAQPPSLYAMWYGAIRALAPTPLPVRPSFMATDAYADLRVDSAVAAYGQLRHNYVLMAAGSYDEGGCEIPDGWVEPAPGVIAALIAYADFGATKIGAIDPDDKSADAAYFKQLGRILRVLRAIVDDELAGRPLTDDEKSFLSMVVEMEPGSTGGPPTFTGWWFDLFQDRQGDGLKTPQLIADYFTSTQESTIAYAGAGLPRLGVFVIDTGGAPRVAVGPVATAWELAGPLDTRYGDDNFEDGKIPVADEKSPWARSYTVAGPAAPAASLTAEGEPDYVPEDQPKKKLEDTVTVTAGGPLGDVTVEIMDHNYRVLASMTKKVAKAGQVVFKFPPRKGSRWEKLHVRVGAWNAWAKVSAGADAAEISSGE
jgi:hypothetical protein